MLDAIPSGTRDGRISLSTPPNRFLIAETAARCARVGEALIKDLEVDKAV
jgi:hypothetical protein